jgi:hypothetical protein
MTDCAGLGNCFIHGWGGSPRNYTLNLSGIAAHTEIRYECYIHQVDSWDSELNQVYTTNNGGGETLRAQWNKVYTGPPYSLSTNGATHSWFGAKYYSYAPWQPSDAVNITNMGYSKVTTDWYSHTDSTFSARHYTGLDQVASDEAYYISHVKVWIRGGQLSLNTITTNSALSDSSIELATQAAVKSYADQFTGTLKNIRTLEVLRIQKAALMLKQLESSV